MTLKVDIKKVFIAEKSGNKELLQDINFTLKPGKIQVILGKNGSGKSTLIKSITNLLDGENYKVSGVVLWNELNLLNLNDRELLSIRNKSIRYVLQDLNSNFDPLKKLGFYFGMTGRESGEIDVLLKSFMLPRHSVLSNLYPYEISGGMAQRLSLLLAMEANPELLILDEPTSAVDYVNMNLIKIKLNSFVDNTHSVLMVTHDINFARNVADEIAFLHEGRLSDFVIRDLFFSGADNKIYSGFLNAFAELQ